MELNHVVNDLDSEFGIFFTEMDGDLFRWDVHIEESDNIGITFLVSVAGHGSLAPLAASKFCVYLSYLSSPSPRLRFDSQPVTKPEQWGLS